MTSDAKISELKNQIGQRYFTWLDNRGIFDHFSTPNSIPSLCYELDYPVESQSFLEDIFSFLESFDVISEASGTYVISRELDRIRELWKRRFSFVPNKTLDRFMDKGLLLLDDIIQGGTGSWDEIKDHILIEQIMTLPQFHIMSDTIFNTRSSTYLSDNPRLGVYSIFPQVCMEYILSIQSRLASIQLIAPTSQIKKQIISYCELVEPMRKFSSHVTLVQELLPESHDIIFVPNGLLYNQTLRDQINLLRGMVKKNGVVFFPNPDNQTYTLGIEPLLSLHPKFNKSVDLKNVAKMFKANGFTSIPKDEEASRFVHVKREE